MNSNPKYEECKGCATTFFQEDNYTSSSCVYADKIHTFCPCSKCLIKMVCVDVCDEYLKIAKYPIMQLV